MKLLIATLILLTSIFAWQQHEYTTAMNECQKRFSFDVCIVNLS